jgi:hypothetical protein
MDIIDFIEKRQLSAQITGPQPEKEVLERKVRETDCQ